MKRDESGFGNFSALPLAAAIAALGIICLFSAATASALTPQGKGGTIKPAPTPPPPAIKTTPPKRSAPTARTTRATPSKSGDSNAAEIAFWNTIKDSTDPEDFRAYLKEYPQGKFTSLARNRLNALEAPAKAEAARKEEAKRKEDEAAATERTYWESIKNSNNPEDFREYLRRYPNGQFADLAKNKVSALNSSRTTTGNPVSTPKPVAGAWVVPEVDGDSNCLDTPCKVIRRVVTAAATNFKPIHSEDTYSSDGSYYTDSSAVLPDFSSLYCRVFPQREGLAPTFYHCAYDSSKAPYRPHYEKYLGALGRALPGWYFKSQQVVLGNQTWDITMAGPKACTLQTCPIKLRLLDRENPYGQLVFEVEAAHDRPEEMLSDSFKKQFLEDIDAMFAAAASNFRTVSEKEQSFAKHGFECLDPTFTNAASGHAERFCKISPLPMGRAERLLELAQQAIRAHKPDWKIIEDSTSIFKVAPPATCQNIYDCGGASAEWRMEGQEGIIFYFTIENPPKKR